MVHVNLFAKQKWDMGVENKHILLFYLGSQKSLEPWHIPHCAGWLWTGWLWHCALLSLGMSSCPLCQITPTANCVTGDMTKCSHCSHWLFPLILCVQQAKPSSCFETAPGHSPPWESPESCPPKQSRGQLSISLLTLYWPFTQPMSS